MAQINLVNCSVSFTVYSASSRSLTSHLLSGVAGGKFISGKKHPTVLALDTLNLNICDGERVAILGNNGAGKSTFLRLIAGIYAPTSGSIAIEGRATSLLDINLGLNSEASGIENVFVRGAILGLSRKEIKNKLPQIVSFSELGEFIHLPLRTYSAGMQMRLAFAIATIANPEILVMDEWLSVGDEKFVAKAEARLRQMVNASSILVIASHSRELVENVCTRAIWLEHGQVKMDGPAREVAQAYFG